MKKREIEKLRKVLVHRRNDIGQRNPQADGLNVEMTADSVEEAQSRSLCELAVQLMNANWETQRAIDTALDRIQSGEYGECEECREQISGGRLAAIPWATFCIACQKEAEQEEPLLVRRKV